MNDELDAIRRVLAADIESFRRLVERFKRPLLTVIRNLTPPDSDHEGFAQEGFLAASVPETSRARQEPASAGRAKKATTATTDRAKPA